VAIKLHRCPLMWLKIGPHACWRVQKALDEAGIEYEVVREPLARPRRERVKALTGQEKLPVIEFEDGSAYREESKDMAARIRAGELRAG
jgi:glutathione S-transferase